MNLRPRTQGLIAGLIVGILGLFFGWWFLLIIALGLGGYLIGLYIESGSNEEIKRKFRELTSLLFKK
jgi:uncharacterized membrane protein